MGESRAVLSAPADPAAKAGDLAGDDGYRTIAAHRGVEGAFNINSTSVAAWQAVLASLQPEQPYTIKTLDGSIGRTGGTGTLVSRHVPVLDEQFDGVPDQLEQELLTWTGHRRLDNYQIELLAREIVKQVKARGPFQSLAEFVNRRPEAGEQGVAGALQAAILHDWDMDTLDADVPVDVIGGVVTSTGGGTPVTIEDVSFGSAYTDSGLSSRGMMCDIATDEHAIAGDCWCGAGWDLGIGGGAGGIQL